MAEILLHICCGPCTIGPLGVLRSEGHDVWGYFYNPNIHPYSEHEKRWEALKQLAAWESLPVEREEGYPLREYLEGSLAAQSRGENRCAHCYDERLTKAAQKARATGRKIFTTTLLGSPYQSRELVLKAGRRAAEREGVEFMEADFRSEFRSGWQKARELGLYTQKYCGCVFSEHEAFLSRERRKRK